MKKIGFLEIGILSSSVLLLGLIVWFLTLTFFGSSSDSQAALLSSLSSGLRDPGSASAADAQGEEAKEAREATGAMKAKEEKADQDGERETGSGKREEGEGERGLEEKAIEANRANESREEKTIEAVETTKVIEATKMTQATEAVDLTGANKAIETNKATAAIGATGAVEAAKASEVAPSSSSTQERPQPPSFDAGAVAYAPRGNRDPMMTPEELAQIQRQKKIKKERDRLRIEGELARQKASDPFEIAKKKINVQGVLHTEDGMLAIVNDQILRQGESYLGAKIVQINGNKVIFKFKGRIFEKIFKGD